MDGNLTDKAGLGRRLPLKLKEDTLGRVFVQGLTEVEIASPEQALEVLRRGAASRRKAGTALNHQSSRSHSVFGLSLVRPCPAEEAAAAASAAEDGCPAELLGRVARMSFVDLAGSERANRYGGAADLMAPCPRTPTLSSPGAGRATWAPG